MAYDKNDFGGEGYQAYLRKIRAIGNIESKEEERRLIIAWQDEQCEKSRTKLINSHLKYAASLTKKYMNSGVSEEDLLSVATEGLVKAIDRFDRLHDVRLSTYAMWWIKAELGNAALSNIHIMRVPLSNDHKKIFNNLARTTAKVTQENPMFSAREIDEAVAQELGTSFEKIRDMRIMKTAAVSLDQPLSANDDSVATLADAIPDTSAASVDEMLEEQDMMDYRKRLLRTAMVNLLSNTKNGTNERNLTIFKRRHYDGETLETIASEMGVSKERIRQIEVKTMEKISTEVKRLERADQKQIERRITSARSRRASSPVPAPVN